MDGSGLRLSDRDSDPDREKNIEIWMDSDSGPNYIGPYPAYGPNYRDPNPD